jgi:hypothetical protein
MAKDAKHEAGIPNPTLQPLSILVGEWDTVGTRPLLPDTLQGPTAFEWLAGGAFLMMYSEIEEPGVPSAIAIFGSDEATEEFFMLSVDARGVSRKYEMSLRDNIWKLWRNGPDFSSRFTGTFDDSGDTIIGIWEILEDGSTWTRDLELTYTRVKESRSEAMAPQD